MKIVVISDTHGRRARISEVLSRQGRYDLCIFLGDGLRDFCIDESERLCAVRGNCDAFSSFCEMRDVPSERAIDADGFKVLMMHGHEWGVKSSHTRAAAHAASMGADVLLYGHTHVPEEKYYPEGSELCGVVLQKPLYVFNPGSLGVPRDGNATFGVIEIKNGQILMSHGSL